MRQIILPFAVLLFGSTVYAQVDPGHSILRSAAFSRSSSCADGSCGTPAVSDFEANSGYADPAFASCPNGNCGLRTAYSQPITASDGGCADGSCGWSISYVSGNSNYMDYETAASFTGYDSGTCATAAVRCPSVIRSPTQPTWAAVRTEAATCPPTTLPVAQATRTRRTPPWVFARRKLRCLSAAHRSRDLGRFVSGQLPRLRHNRPRRYRLSDSFHRFLCHDRRLCRRQLFA